MEKKFRSKDKLNRSENDHTKYPIRCLRVSVCKFFLPHNQLWLEIAKFIVNLHQNNFLDAMERLDLALDALDDSDTPDSG